MKKLIVFIVVISFGMGLLPKWVELPWQSAYETVLFDTYDGDLGLEEYAVADESGWYIRKFPKNQSQFNYTQNAPDIFGKKLVAIVCEQCAYYSEFSNGKKSVRLRITGQEFGNMSKPNFQQPKPLATISLGESLFSEVRAAISFNSSTTTGSITTAASSYTFSHTTLANSNLFLMLATTLYDTTDADRDITSSTYNGILLTQVREDDSGSDIDIETGIWYLVNPATGSNTVSLQFAGTVTSFLFTAVSYNGVSQTNPIDAQAGTGAGNQYLNRTEASTTITTVHSNAWIFDSIVGLDGVSACGDISVNAGQTDRLTSTSTVGMSDKVMSIPGATSTGWSGAVSTCDWVHSVVAFQEAPIVRLYFIKGSACVLKGARMLIK